MLMYGKSKEVTPLSSQEAERLLNQVRRACGMGQAYRLKVRPTKDGRWRVSVGSSQTREVAPLDRARLLRWFRKEFADVIAERTETSEG